MSRKKRRDPADPFPLIVWEEGDAETAVIVEEAAAFEEVAPSEAPAAKVEPAANLPAVAAVAAPRAEKTGKKGKKNKAPAPAPLPKVKSGTDYRFWLKAANLVVAAAAAAVLVAGIVWWSRPAAAPETPEKPFETALVGSIADLEKGLVKSGDAAPTAREGGLSFGYAAGDVLSYNFEYVQTVTLGVSELFMKEAERHGGKVTASQGQSTKLGYKMSGRADLAVYEAGGRMSVGWRFTQMALELRGGPDKGDPAKLDALRSELNREVLVDMTPLGKIEAIHFPKGTTAWAESLLSAAVLMARVTFPGKEAASWTAIEEDATGRYVAEYVADGGYRSGDDRVTRIGRTKREYQQVASFTGGEASTLSSEACRMTLGGGVVGLFDPDAGRFRTLRVDEKIRVEGIEFVQDVVSNTAGGMRLTGASRDEALAADGKARAEALRQAGEIVMPGSADIAARLAVDAEQARIRALTGGMTVEEVVSKLEKLAFADALDTPEAEALFDSLVAILRTNDASVDVALEFIRSTTAHLAVRAAIVDALGAAETPRAQEALLAVVRDPALEADLRQNAVTGLAMADKPVEGSLGTVRAVVAAGAGDPASEAALLGIGLLYRKAAQADSGRAELLAEDLRDAGRLSSDPSWQSMYLESLGNAGLSGSVPEIEKFLSRDDERTRARAAFALRFIDGTDERLAGIARSDASPKVRIAAVQALSFRKSPAARAAIELAAKDEDPRVKAEAEKALGQ
ncbi:MAG: HEAT repeat domain-containing protein [Planctomycetes bacterium]|nr:HEAT repeat domain-containing protein [Planctomycetota bacterium]